MLQLPNNNVAHYLLMTVDLHLYIHDDNHLLNDFLEKCPSGRYRTIKYTSTHGAKILLYARQHSS